MPFEFEYITGLTTMYPGDAIYLKILNDSDTPYEAGFRMNTLTELGNLQKAEVPAYSWWGAGFQIKVGNQHWVQIFAASEFLIPDVLFERKSGMVAYTPGAFAAFRLGTTRTRIW